MKHRTLSLLALSLMLIAQTAVAASDGSDVYNRHQGWYGEVLGGTNIGGADVNDIGHGGFGVSGALGYQFTSIIGVEAGYIRNQIDDLHIDNGYVAARLTAPIGDRFSLFGKLGGIYSNFGGGLDDSIVSPFIGAGLAYSVTPQLDINAQIQGFVHSGLSIGVVGGGLTYHV